MPTFRGILEVEGEPESAVVSDVEVVAGVINLHAGGASLGSWNLNDISIEPGEDFFRIEAEEEVLRLRLRDAKRFAATVGVGLPEKEMGTLSDLAPAVKEAGNRPSEPTKDAVQEPVPPIEPVPPDPIPDEATAMLGPDESSLAKPFAWAMGGAALILLFGALLPWGPWRLVDGRFPVERLIGALGALAAGAGAYLALAGEKRRDVALVSMLGGLIGIVVILLYVIDSPIGIGFVVTIVATTAVATISIISLLPSAAAPPKEDDQPHLRI